MHTKLFVILVGADGVVRASFKGRLGQHHVYRVGRRRGQSAGRHAVRLSGDLSLDSVYTACTTFCSYVPLFSIMHIEVGLRI